MDDVLSSEGKAYRLPVISYVIGYYHNILVRDSGMDPREFSRIMVEYTSILNSFRNSVDYLLVKEFVKACVSVQGN